MKSIVLLFAIAALFLPASLVLAQTPAPCPAGAVCIPNWLGTADFGELIDRIIGFLFVIGIPISVIMTIVGAFYLMLSGGRPEYLITAKNIFKWIFIGLMILLLSKGLISAVTGLFGV